MTRQRVADGAARARAVSIKRFAVKFANCDAVRSNSANGLLFCPHLEIVFLLQGVREVRQLRIV
jgi:hypothetical protein